MSKNASRRFLLLFSLVAILGLCSWSLVFAADPVAVSPGLAQAETVQEGAKVEGILKNGETDNFKTDLGAGYQLRVFGSAIKNGGIDSKLIINILNSQGVKLSTGQVTADGVANAEAFFYKGLTQSNMINPETVYVEVKADGPMGGNLNYRVSFEKTDRSDAGANTDAGDQQTSALDLQLTKETINFDKNFLGKNPCGSSEQPKYCSTDDKDVYTFSIAAGKKVAVQIVPSAKMKLVATLLDQNKNTLKTAAGASDGAIVNLEYSTQGNQQLYLEITSPAPSFFGSYGLQFVSSAGTTPVSPTPVLTATPGYTPTESPTVSPSGDSGIWAYRNYLIIGGIIVVAVVVLWLVLSLIRKKQSQTSTADIEKLRQQMKGSPAAVPKAPAAPKPVPTIGTVRTMHTDMKRLSSVRPAPSPAVKPRFNPSVAPRGSVGSSKPSFMPAMRRSTPVPADSDIGTFPRKAPAPDSLPTSPVSAPAPVKSPPSGGPTRPTPPSLPSRPVPPTPPPVAKLDEKAKADIDQIFGA